MTISDDEALRSGPYNGNGATTVFDYDFTIFATSDLTLNRRNADGTQTPLVLTTDYTVQGAGNAGGGTVTLVSGDRLPTGATLTITSNIAATQGKPFSSQSSISLEEIELALDKVTALIRKQEEAQLRALTVPVDSTTSAQLVGLPVAGASLVFDDDGNIAVGPTSVQIAAAQGYAEDALASRNAASGSADNAAASALLAQDWAEEVEDTEVEAGKFSALHWAAKAQEYVGSLVGFAGLATNGIVVRTGAETAVTRTITAGTGISVANGDGVSGNPTINSVQLAQAQVEDDTSTVFGQVSGQRLGQAIAAQGVWEIIDEVVISGTPSIITATFTGSDYSEVGLILGNIRPSTDGADLLMRFNGASGASDYNYQTRGLVGGSTFTSTSFTTSAIKLTGAIGTASGEDGAGGSVKIPMPGLARETYSVNHIVSHNSDGLRIWEPGQGTFKSGVAVNSVSLLLSSGTFESGSVTVYGIRKA